MSPRSSNKKKAAATAGVQVQKPKSNVYTMMLFLSLVAISIAIGLLCAEMARYEWDIKAQNGGLRPRPNLNVSAPTGQPMAQPVSRIA